MPFPLTTTFLLSAAIMEPIDQSAAVILVCVAVVIQLVLFVVSALVTDDELG